MKRLLCALILAAAAAAVAAPAEAAPLIDLAAEGYSQGEEIFSADAGSAESVFGSFFASGDADGATLDVVGFDPFNAADFSFLLSRPPADGGGSLSGDAIILALSLAEGLDAIFTISGASGEWAGLSGDVRARVSGAFDLGEDFFGVPVSLSLSRLDRVVAAPLPSTGLLLLGAFGAFGALAVQRRRGAQSPKTN